MITLYIIGNGFDLHHGLKTRYSDFANWLEDNYGGTYDWIETVYGYDNCSCWADYEESLGVLRPLAFEVWYHNLNSENLETAFVYHPLSCFSEWADQLSSDCKPDKEFEELFKEEHAFLTFNYTTVLERVYGIDPSKVCHIHGGTSDERASVQGSDIIVGHAESDQPPYPFSTQEVYEKALEFFEKTKKGSSSLIEWRLKPFIEKIEPRILRIIVMGSSLSNADLPYFLFLIGNIRGVRWTLYYHGEEEKEKKLKFCEEHLATEGIPYTLVEW